MKTTTTTRTPFRSGFTMLEIMVAVGLMAFCLVPVMVFNQRNLAEAGITQEEILARQYLINMCERYKNEPRETLRDLAGNPAAIESDPLLLQTGNGNQGPSGFRRRVLFEEDFKGNTGIHRVVFEVSWASLRRRQTRTLKLARLVHWH